MCIRDRAKARLKNLSETDKIRDNSKVGSGFGKNISNWLERDKAYPVSYTHLRAHETVLDLVCRLLLAKKTQQKKKTKQHLPHDYFETVTVLLFLTFTTDTTM